MKGIEKMKRIGLAVFVLVCLVLFVGLGHSYAQPKEPDKQKNEAWSYKNAVVVRNVEKGEKDRIVSFRLESFTSKRLKVSCYISYRGEKVSETEAYIVNEGLSDKYTLHHWANKPKDWYYNEYLSVQIEDAQPVSKN